MSENQAQRQLSSRGNGAAEWWKTWFPLIVFVALQGGGTIWFAARLDVKVQGMQETATEIKRTVEAIKTELGTIREAAARRDEKIKHLERQHGFPANPDR